MKSIQITLITLLLIITGCSSNNSENQLELSGTIETVSVTVSSKTAGQIVKLNASEGESVVIGDTLLVIDHENYELQKSQAEAALEAAEANYNLLINGARKEDLSNAEETLFQIKQNYETVYADFQRFKNLYEKKAITKKQFDEISAKYEITKSQLRQAEENLRKLKNFARPEELSAAKAKVNQAEASLNLIKKTISDCFVTAPTAGVVTNQLVEIGEMVVPQSSLFKISNLSNAEIYVYVQETDLGKLNLGDKAEIKIDTYPDKIYEGEITYISQEAEFTPKTIQTKDERTKLVFAVKVEAANNNFELKPGLPADVKIYLD